MRALLFFLARQQGFKDFILRFRIFRETAWRFVAGETLSEAVPAVRAANAAGMRASLDHLGENVRSREDAVKAVAEAKQILDTIRAEKIDCNLSVKLTQLGLDVDEELCRANLAEIVGHAAEIGNFVRV